MKRSLQEVIELVVFGLIALLLGTGLLWLAGAAFGLVGTVLGWLAGLVWALLRFLVPVALVAALAVFLVRAAQGRSAVAQAPTPAPTPVPTVDAVPPSPPVVAATTPTREPGTDPAPTADAAPAADAAPTGAAAADATGTGSGDGPADTDADARPRDGA